MILDTNAVSALFAGDPALIILPVDETTAETYSQVRDELRQKGRPIPENDIWISALARQHGLPVVSQDGHFDEVPELRRVEW